MEKINIAVGFKGDEAIILKQGGVDEVLSAYKAAELDTEYDFVGMLRKPVWYKRNTPKRNAAREIERAREAEANEVRVSKEEAAAFASEAEAQAKIDAQVAAEAAARDAAAAAEQAALNATIEEMEAQERQARQEAADEAAAAAAAAVSDPAPSAEEEARAAAMASGKPKKK